MSEVKRYSFWPQIVHLPAGGGVRAEVHFKVEEDGLFVAHQDYARLKAEVDRLTAFTTRTIIPNEELQAQVERLTKAGSIVFDYMEAYAEQQGLDHNWETVREVWIKAAKEGKQP